MLNITSNFIAGITSKKYPREDVRVRLAREADERQQIENYQNSLTCTNPASDYDANEIDELTRNPANSGVYKQMICLIKESRLSLISSYLRDLYVISSGVEGTVFSATFDPHNYHSQHETDKLFAVKLSKGGAEDLAHEAFISLLGTNKLRDEIPNFSYCYGTFSCAGPVVEGKEIISWCSPSDVKIDDSVRYVVYENVRNSITLSKWITTQSTPKDFKIIYLQTLLALWTAKQKIGYTHNDLHDGNVLIRKLDKSYQIGYNVARNRYYTASSPYLSVIVDYGHSRIPGHQPSGLEFIPIGDNDNILGDAYKLLLFCARRCYDYDYNKNTEEIILGKVINPEILEICRELYFFFSSERLEDVLRYQYVDKYYLPFFEINDRIRDRNFLQYINYFLRLNKDDPLLKRRAGALLSCRPQEACDRNSAESLMLLPVESAKTSFIAYADAKARFPNVNIPLDLEAAKRTYRQDFQRYLRALRQSQNRRGVIESALYETNIARAITKDQEIEENYQLLLNLRRQQR